MSSNVGLVVERVTAGLGEGAAAVSGLSAAPVFLCLRATEVLARADATPDDTEGSEFALRFVAM